MDEIESYIYEWVFDGKDHVILENRLKEMPKDNTANEKFKNLHKIVQKELVSRGANKTKVPMVLRGFNIFLFVLTLVLIFRHITFNKLNIYNLEKFTAIALFAVLIMVMMLPLIMGIIGVILNLIIIIRQRINKIIQKKTRSEGCYNNNLFNSFICCYYNNYCNIITRNIFNCR